jgi:hypothetical protein
MKLDPRSLKTRKERSVKKQALPLLFLLLSLLLSVGAFAQTTTSYRVTGGSGTATTPTRISFDTSLAANQFFESGYGTACGNQTTQALGFVLLNGGEFGQGVCAVVTTQPVGTCGNLYAEFYGTDASGVRFHGSVSLTTTCKYVHYRYSKTIYTVTGGTLTIAR